MTPCGEYMHRLLASLLLCAALTDAIAQQASPADTVPIPDAPSSAPDPQRALPLDRLAAELKKGGYVIYFRHAATDFSKPDGAMTSYDDCANQRLLSADGR